MPFLPKGEPLFENVATNRISLPAIMEKLATKEFTGYLTFLFPETVELYLTFESGKLTFTLAETPCGQRQSGLDALITISRLLATESEGIVSAYELSPTLAAQVQLLLRSEVRIKSQLLKTTDMRGLLERMKQERFSGCLRAYGDESVSLIFYQQGTALGFFHDGSTDLEKSATASQRAVTLANPKIDLFECIPSYSITMDLLKIINIQNLWDCVLGHCQQEGKSEASAS